MPDRSESPHQHEQRLDNLIAEYLELVDAGTAVERDEFLQRYPEHDLARYFENVGILEDLVRRDSQAGEDHLPGEDDAGEQAGDALTRVMPAAETSVMPVPAEADQGADRRKFGRYEIIRPLGQGAMGVVYLALDTQLHREVALKMPRVAPLDRDETLERFRREARSAGKLRHPNICPVYDVGEVDGQHYISMAYVNGYTLREFAGASTRQPEALVALTIRKIALALAEAHRQGIIHRDLKSANVMVDENGEPIVMDFGLARSVAADDGDVTQTGTTLGTPGYMSPEQVEGRQDEIGPASDIYSLGVVCYELLTGKLPFTGAVHAVLRQITSEDPQPPAKFHRDLAPQLGAICLKAMAKRPSDRYPSMDELAEDLRRFLAHEPTLARPAGWMQRTGKWLRRHAAQLGLLGVAAAAATAVIGLAARPHDEPGAAGDSGSMIRDTRAPYELQAVQSSYERALLAGQQEGAHAALLRLAESLQLAVAMKVPELEASIRLQMGAWGQDLWRLHRVFPHGSNVFAVAISPSGELVVTGGDSGAARFWNTTTGEPVGTLLEHGGTVFAVAFSPDGSKVLTGSGDRTAQIWETATGKRLGPPLRHDNRVLAVAFSPDGRLVLTGSHDGTARLWAVDTGDPVGAPLEHGAIVRCVAFSPDGETILTGGDDNTARLWQAATHLPTGQTFKQRAAIFAGVFSPDGSKVLTGGSDCQAQLWDVATGSLRASLSHHQRVLAAGISPDGRTMITGSQDRSVRFWGLETGRPLGRLQHGDEVRAAVYGADANLVLTGGWDGTARLWKMAGPARLQNDLPMRSGVFSADSRSLVTVGARSAQRWDITTGRLLETLLQFDRFMTAGAISPDGRRVVTGDTEGVGHVWDIASGRPITPAMPHPDRIRIAVFSPDGELVLTASHHHPARIFHAETGEVVSGPLQHEAHINGAVFSANGKRVLTASDDQTVQLWDVVTGERLGPALRHADDVLALALSPDNSLIATACQNGRVQLWDLETYEAVGPSLAIRGLVHALTFSPDSDILFTGSDDGTVCLWDVASGRRLGPPLAHPSRVESVTVSPDGERLLTRCEDLSVWLRSLIAPMERGPDELTLWTQVITGMELDEQGAPRVLDLATWRERRRQLAQHPLP